MFCFRRVLSLGWALIVDLPKRDDTRGQPRALRREKGGGVFHNRKEGLCRICAHFAVSVAAIPMSSLRLGGKFGFLVGLIFVPAPVSNKTGFLMAGSDPRGLWVCRSYRVAQTVFGKDRKSLEGKTACRPHTIRKP